MNLSEPRGHARGGGNREYAREVKLTGAGQLLAFATACQGCSLDSIIMASGEGDSKVSQAGDKALHSRKGPVDLV